MYIYKVCIFIHIKFSSFQGDSHGVNQLLVTNFLLLRRTTAPGLKNCITTHNGPMACDNFLYFTDKDCRKILGSLSK